MMQGMEAQVVSFWKKNKTTYKIALIAFGCSFKYLERNTKHNIVVAKIQTASKIAVHVQLFFEGYQIMYKISRNIRTSVNRCVIVAERWEHSFEEY